MNPTSGARLYVKPWVAIVIGVVFAGVGLLLGFLSFQFLQGAAYADGVVTSIEAHKTVARDSDGTHTSTTYNATVSFTDAKGIGHTFTDDTSFGLLFSYQQGDRVKVAYRPDSPELAQIDSIMSLWLLPLGFLVLGLLVAIAGIAGARGQIPVVPSSTY